MLDFENENLLFDMAISENILAYNPLYQQCLQAKNNMIKELLNLHDEDDDFSDDDFGLC